MPTAFTIIDHFSVTDTLAEGYGQGLAIGTWFVVQPGIQSLDLPGVGSPVLIETPTGSTLRAHVSDCVVRHGAAAFRFGGPELTELPRLSIVRSEA